MGDFQDWDNELDGSWDYDLPLGSIDRNMDNVSYAGTPISISNSAGDKDGEKRKTPPDVEDGSPSVDPHDTEPKRRGGFLPFLPLRTELCGVILDKYISIIRLHPFIEFSDWHRSRDAIVEKFTRLSSTLAYPLAVPRIPRPSCSHMLYAPAPPRKKFLK